MHLRPMFLALGMAAAAAATQAATPHSLFLAEGGVTVHGSYAVTVGASWAWPWQRMGRRGQWSGATEAFASHWRARSRAGAGREGYTQVGVAPVLRYRFGRGQSPWFAEGGIGVSWFDSVYETDRKQFSTRFNFYDTVGVGRSFGRGREHEWSLRFTHISNAGIRKPNPGENVVQLRYTRRL